MSSFVIENGKEVHEAFTYQRPLNDDSLRALGEYARANYGPEACLRPMTPAEEAGFDQYGEAYFKRP